MEIEVLVDVSETAEWRRRKAEQFPEDERNEKAAALLESLACDLPNASSDIQKELVRLWEEKENFIVVVSEKLREVGFLTFPNSVDEMLEDIASSLRD